MIHFNFIVSDADAENIFSMIHDRINSNNMAIIKLIGKAGQEPYIEAYQQHNEYVKDLIKKMSNVRVEE